MYTIFIGYFLFMGLLTGSMILVSSINPDTPIITPWNVAQKLNQTNIPQTPVLYNGSNPNDNTTLTGHMLNPINSSGGTPNVLNKIFAFGQITIEVVWYWFTIITATFGFQLLTIMGVPQLAIALIQFPVGVFASYLIYHAVTGKL